VLGARFDPGCERKSARAGVWRFAAKTGSITPGTPPVCNSRIRYVYKNRTEPSEAHVSQPLADPEPELYDGNGSLIFQNDNWRSEQEAQIVASGMAPSAEKESAIIITLPAGNYSAVVRGVGGAEGVALVEIYALE
jgi:hypothetical protein